MSWSLSEIQALAVKATRGAGFAHGIAEEAGVAVRWLAARHLPGPEALTAYLQALEQGASCRVVTTVPPEPASEDAPYCPLILGTALVDFARQLNDLENIELGAVRQPMLLLPFVGRDELHRFRLSGFTPGAGGETAAGLVDMAQCQLHSRKDAALPQPAPAVRVGDESGAAVATLELFAHRTYAPATEASREKGAGAGTTDND